MKRITGAATTRTTTRTMTPKAVRLVLLVLLVAAALAGTSAFMLPHVDAATAASATAARATAARTTITTRVAQSCASASYHEFDFWIGDWDAYDANHPATITARNRVEPILGGCALREIYDGTNGLSGESFSIYDSTRHAWHQSWVTNRGQLLLLDGAKRGDRIVLSGADHDADGHSATIRGVWRVVDGGVRETADRTSDGGATWKPVFDIIFRKHTK